MTQLRPAFFATESCSAGLQTRAVYIAAEPLP
jgi:hypothetical protein